MQRFLFSERRLADVLASMKIRVVEEIEEISRDQLLNASVPALVQEFVGRFTLQTPRLNEAAGTHSLEEAQVDGRVSPNPSVQDRYSEPQWVPGFRYTFRIPYEGADGVFYCVPNHGGPANIRGHLEGRALVFTVDTERPDASLVNARVDEFLASIKRLLQASDALIQPFNSELPTVIEKHIVARRQKLLEATRSAAQIRFPLALRGGAPSTFAPPTVQRRPTVEISSAPVDAFRPEPQLVTEDYEHILDVMQNMSLVLERSPKAFVDMDEETLRVMFLVQLNGHFAGQATGETFNYEGKTDILIRYEGRNIFVAECKFWSGPEKFKETVDQLLGYLSWRDTRAALVIFNRNKDFSSVVQKIQTSLRSHSNFKKEIPTPPKRPGFRAVLRHRDDEQREVLLTVLTYDVPT